MKKDTQNILLLSLIFNTRLINQLGGGDGCIFTKPYLEKANLEKCE